MLYNRCDEVDENFWEELAQARPEEVAARTGVRWQDGAYLVPNFHRELVVAVGPRRIRVADAPAAEPGFRRCLTVLLYLLRLEPARLGPPVSPLELPGATLFFQKSGPHALPRAPLEERFGRDLAAFQEAGRRLKGEPLPQGDAAFAFEVFPGLRVGVMLWQADEEFPPQVSFSVPSRLDAFWQLDAVLALLGVVVKELLAAVRDAA